MSYELRFHQTRDSNLATRTPQLFFKIPSRKFKLISYY
jgi:hypothetical protein